MMNRFLPLLIVCGFIHAARANDVGDQLDALEASMNETRANTDRVESSLEDVRRSLYEAALKARETKLTGDAMIQAREDLSIDEATIDRIRQFMVLSARELRALRDRVDALDGIVKTYGDAVASQEDSFRQLKDAVAAIEERGPPQKAHPDELEALQKQLADANATIAVQNNSMQQLNEELATLRATITAPKVTVVERVEDVNPVDEALRAGSDALAEGDFDAAKEAFTGALNLDGESIDARLGLSSCHFETGDFDTARTLVDEVLDIESRNARALGLRGAIKYRQGNYSSARRDLERAIRYDESNPNNYNYLGVVFQQMDKYPEAIENVRRAVELDPEYASARYNLSVLLATAETPDLDAARSEYQQYRELGGRPSPELERILGAN